MAFLPALLQPRLWARAEFTTTCKNWLELLFKAKQCYSFIVNMGGEGRRRWGECYLQGCALIFLHLLKQQAHRRIHSLLKLHITTMTYSTIHFEHSWKVYLILLLLFLSFSSFFFFPCIKLVLDFIVSSPARIYLHSSADINSAVLIYTAGVCLIIIFVFVWGVWCILGFMEDKKKKICTVAAEGMF